MGEAMWFVLEIAACVVVLGAAIGVVLCCAIYELAARIVRTRPGTSWPHRPLWFFGRGK